jgi:L-lactate dehydrogenase (cytochrome)
VKAASALDYRELARRRLPHFLFEYIDGGANDEITLRRNIDDLREVTLRQRVLRDVSKLDLSTELFGQKLSMPVALGPIGLGGMTSRRGEVSAARAAHAAGVQFCLSTVSLCALPEVAAGVKAPFWFQLYVIRDRGFMRDLLAQAKEVGVSALFFTVDMPMPGTRYRDQRSGLGAGNLVRTWQALQRPHWAWDVGLRGRPHVLGNLLPVLGKNSGMEDYMAWLANNFDPSITWKDLDFIRSEWDGPLVIKGVLDPDDAKQAAELGADGVIVSNHGGRQLDGASSTARALGPIADAVGDRLTVLADGGVRSGLDVVRMLALGAKGVILGRAWAFALAGAGGRGVAHLLELIESEMRAAMALTGCTTVSQIDRSILGEAARAMPRLR